MRSHQWTTRPVLPRARTAWTAAMPGFPASARSTRRDNRLPGYRNDFLGLRVALVPADK